MFVKELKHSIPILNSTSILLFYGNTTEKAGLSAGRLLPEDRGKKTQVSDGD